MPGSRVGPRRYRGRTSPRRKERSWPHRSRSAGSRRSRCGPTTSPPPAPGTPTSSACSRYYARPEPPAPPSYLEFRLGDHGTELGIIDRRFALPGLRTGEPGGIVAYWAVDDVEKALDEFLAAGATPLQPLTEYGPGFVTAAVVDPFGNVVGLMYNQHYLDVVVTGD